MNRLFLRVLGDLRDAVRISVLGALLLGSDVLAQDPVRDLQVRGIETMSEKHERLFAFGWQGLDGRFSTHTNHSNRLIPLMTFGPYGDLSTLRGPNSAYRSENRLGEIFGRVPPATLDPRHEAIDQTEVHHLMRSAVDRGCKRVVVLLLDGGDWHTQTAASIVAHDAWDPEGLGAGLAWFEYSPPGIILGDTARDQGFVVTSPLRGGVAPGYDIARGGRFPWSSQNAQYLAGDYYRDSDGRPTANRSVHAVVDSAASATAIFSGRKTTNGKINQGPDGKTYLPLGLELQQLGFTVATVTDVPFDHASPACVYASEESRNNYQAIGGQMVGQADFEGADLVFGYGFGYGEEKYLSNTDLEAAAERYRVVTPEEGRSAAELLDEAVAAAVRAIRSDDSKRRVFGFFGRDGLDHAPYRTADGGYDPVAGVSRSGGVGEPEVYSEADLAQQPTLLQMTQAATGILEAAPEDPFLLFVEAGLVDWSLHANNLDNAVGEVLSAEEVFGHLSSWITEHNWWGETLLVVTSDHGHLLQVDFDGLRNAIHGER